MFKRKMLAAVLFTIAAVGAHAADLSTYKGPLPAALQNAKKSGGLEVLKPFQAAGGLKGWVVQDTSSGKNVVVYTTADGEVLLAGMALDKTGRNLTNVYAEQHVPATDYSPAFKAFTSDAASVVVGNAKAKAEITVLFDANCGYCKLMSKLVAPSVAAGELRVRYVPVAILGGDSPEKGAGLLASKNPDDYIAADANGSDLETSNDKALLAKVQKNTELMKKYGFNGTPVVLYKSGKGNDETLNVSPGLPEVTEMFRKLGISGQLSKLKADPSVARYVR